MRLRLMCRPGCGRLVRGEGGWRGRGARGAVRACGGGRAARCACWGGFGDDSRRFRRGRQGAAAPGGEQGVERFGEVLELQPEQNHRGPVAERNPAQGHFKLRDDACPMVHGRSYTATLDEMQGKNCFMCFFSDAVRRHGKAWILRKGVVRGRRWRMTLRSSALQD